MYQLRPLSCRAVYIIIIIIIIIAVGDGDGGGSTTVDRDIAEFKNKTQISLSNLLI
jgi:hypothetical protein